jgi:hypothetical protein
VGQLYTHRVANLKGHRAITALGWHGE